MKRSDGQGTPPSEARNLQEAGTGSRTDHAPITPTNPENSPLNLSTLWRRWEVIFDRRPAQTNSSSASSNNAKSRTGSIADPELFSVAVESVTTNPEPSVAVVSSPVSEP